MPGSLHSGPMCVSCCSSSRCCPTRRSLEFARSFPMPTHGSNLPSTRSCSSGTVTRIRFAHALLASAVSEHEGAERRRDVHRRLAEVEDDSEARARHLALATEGHDADVAAALDHAAHDALARGAPSAAAELLELAIGRTPPGPDVDLTGGKLALADAHFSSGAIGRAQRRPARAARTSFRRATSARMSSSGSRTAARSRGGARARRASTARSRGGRRRAQPGAPAARPGVAGCAGWSPRSRTAASRSTTPSGQGTGA